MPVTTVGIHLSAERDDLYAALRKVEPLLADRPELRYLRVQANGDLSLCSTDRDLLISARLNAEVFQPGSVIAYGRFLVEFVRRAPAGKVTLRSLDDQLYAEDGGAFIKLATFADSAWPNFQHVHEGGVVWASAALQQVKRVLHAYNKDESRPLLQGVCFRNGWAAATDSHQLAAVRVGLPEGTDAVIPGSAMDHVLRLAGNEDVTVRIAENRVSFVMGGATVTSTLLAGTFPDWASVVPQPSGRGIRANRHELLAALERLTFLAQQDDRCCVQIHEDPAGIRIDARLAEVGHQEDRIPGENTVGDVCLQLRHLKTLLEQLTQDDAVFDMSGALTPAVTREGDYIGLLMPIRL